MACTSMCPVLAISNEGQSVLVFLDGHELVGFGQGAFSLTDGMASRGLGPLLPEGPETFSVQGRLPNLESSSECLEPKLWDNYSTGWNLRGVLHTVAKPRRVFCGVVDALEGFEYRFELCGDMQLGSMHLYLLDQDDQVVMQQGKSGRENALVYSRTKPGNIDWSSAPSAFPKQQWRAASASDHAYR